MKKKSQMEMMGLAVVVILVALGMFFLVYFTLGEAKSGAKQAYTAEELAANMVKTMEVTDSACGDRNLNMQELIIAYADNKNFKCNGKDLDVYIKETISDIFERTMGVWNKEYYLQIDVPPDVETGDICLPNEDCISNCREQEEARYIWPRSDYKVVYVVLDVCI